MVGSVAAIGNSCQLIADSGHSDGELGLSNNIAQ